MTSQQQDGVVILGCLDVLFVSMCQTVRAELSVLLGGAEQFRFTCPDAKETLTNVLDGRVLGVRLKAEQHLSALPPFVPSPSNFQYSCI